MMNNDESKEAPSNELRCDYLVVGAGAAGMAFVDTLLTEDPTCRVVLWTAAPRPAATGLIPTRSSASTSPITTGYPLPLGKARDAKGRECFDRDDLASGAEVVAYYEKVLAQFEASGRVDIRLETSYEARGARALLTTNDGTTSWVTPRKTVTTISNVQVPSTRPPPFPVDGVECRPLNALEVPAHASYVVCGAGKSGVDAVCHLLDQGVSTDAITWIVPHDRWMFLGDGAHAANLTHLLFRAQDGIGPSARSHVALLPGARRGVGLDAVAVNLEKQESAPAFSRMANRRACSRGDHKQVPARADPPVAAVRLGRIVAVEPGEIILQQGRLPIAPGCLVVDATAGYDNAPDELFGYNVVDDAFKIFSADSIKLGPSLNLFNVCLSAALTAYLEATCVDDAFKNSRPCYFVTGKTCDSRTRRCPRSCTIRRRTWTRWRSATRRRRCSC